VYFEHCWSRAGYSMQCSPLLPPFIPFAEAPTGCCETGLISENWTCSRLWRPVPPLAHSDSSESLQHRGTLPHHHGEETENTCGPNLSSQWFITAYSTAFTLISFDNYLLVSRYQLSLINWQRISDKSIGNWTADTIITSNIRPNTLSLNMDWDAYSRLMSKFMT